MAVANRKTEVTKLITVTLGKIQESKHAKCGLNLRKSLLVASVLHKARDIYVSEVKNRSVDRRVTDSDRNEESSTVPAKIRKRFSTQRSMSVIEEEEMQSSQQEESDNDNMENNKFGENALSVNPSEAQTTVDDILDELATDSECSSESIATDKENNPPEFQSSVNSCGRCLKRRASTDYPESSDLEHSNDDNFSNQSSTFHIAKKRSRIGSVDVAPERDYNSCAMDTTQINTLVNIFSQSFSEFTCTEPADQSSVYETSTELNTFALCRDSIALTA